MTWLVSPSIKNIYGLCGGDDYYIFEHYTPYSTFGSSRHSVDFQIFAGDIDVRSNNNRAISTWYLGFGTELMFENYIKRTYEDIVESSLNVSNFAPDLNREPWPSTFYNSWGSSNQIEPKEFETEAEALEYANSLQGPIPIVTFEDGDAILAAEFRQMQSGVWTDRSIRVEHSGPALSIYTIQEFKDFLINELGVSDEELDISGEESIGGEINFVPRTGLDDDIPEPPEGFYYWEEAWQYWPGANCPTSLELEIVDLSYDVSSTILIEPDYVPVPGPSTVTVIDGNPGNRIENEDGAVTIHDNGNIIMSNDGGTFFLNEFGNVGFYANNDASLSANTHVQLGVGGTSVTVENNCFTFRDGTGNVELTADDLTRLKALLD